MHFEPTSVTVRVGHGKSDNLAHACADPKWPRDLQVPGVGGVELPWFTPYLSINIRKYQYEKRNMLSQESQKMCFECSVAIKCEILKKN